MTEDEIYSKLLMRSLCLYRVVRWSGLVSLAAAIGLVIPIDPVQVEEERREAAKFGRAVELGMEARQAGEPNRPPYLTGTEEWKAWQIGWHHVDENHTESCSALTS